MKRFNRPARLFLPSFALAFVLLSGCSKFESDWRSPAYLKPPAEGEMFAGRWKGHWKSVPSGHSGSLRCIVRSVDEDAYRAHFNASWALLARFEYVAAMDVERREGHVHFAGRADLGKMGGVYQYDGHTDGKMLYCTYKSASDHGYFKMSRPK